MIEFGKTLREAREAKGLTISQIAEQTHLLSQIVEDMEKEDFHRISAPIYGRGFVKLYCEAVGIEAKPLVDEFMAILTGERQPAIKMRTVELPPDETAGVEGAAEGESESEPSVVEPPAPPVYTQAEFGDAVSAAPVERVVPAEVVRGENRLGDAESLRVANEIPPPPLRRQFHPEYALPSRGLTLPPNLGRLAVLFGGAIAILALLVWGGRALYRASMGESGEPETAQAASAPENGGEVARQETRDASGDIKTRDASGDKATQIKKTPEKKPEAKAKSAEKVPAAAKPTAPRTPKAVPPLYID